MSCKVSATYLEVNNDSEHENGGEKIHQIWKILSVERFSEASDFVLSGGQQMEQRYHGSFEFCAAAC